MPHGCTSFAVRCGSDFNPPRTAAARHALFWPCLWECVCDDVVRGCDVHKNTQMVQQTFGSKPMEYSVSCHRFSAVYCRIRHDLGGQNWSEHFWYIMSRNIIFTISSPGNSSRTLTSQDTFSLKLLWKLAFRAAFPKLLPDIISATGFRSSNRPGVRRILQIWAVKHDFRPLRLWPCCASRSGTHEHVPDLIITQQQVWRAPCHTAQFFRRCEPHLSSSGPPNLAEFEKHTEGPFCVETVFWEFRHLKMLSMH